jgi:hypothetical protein
LWRRPRPKLGCGAKGGREREYYKVVSFLRHGRNRFDIKVLLRIL